MESLTDAIPLPPSLPVQQATHDPPVPRLLPRESPPTSEVGLPDSPDAVERKDRRDDALAGDHDSVQRILVGIQGDRPLRFVCPLNVLPDDEDDLAGDHGEGP